jgi:hypothetical protein
MAKVKPRIEQTVEVELSDGQKTKIVVKKPSNRVTTEAQRRGAVTWNKCVQEGIMTKKELEKFMKERGIWDDGKEAEQKSLVTNINDLEKQIYLSKGRMKLGEAKKLAIEMRKKRIELRELLTEKITFETNTAESISENTKFDYIVSQCTFDTDGEKVYDSLDDYETRADDPIAYFAAQALAEMMFQMDKDFESSLPENKFLKKFKLVNEDLSLINKDGHTVDIDGSLINELGHFLDGDGGRIDKQGNKLLEDGTYVIQGTYLDEDGKVVPDPDKKKAAKVKAESPPPKKEETEEPDAPDS